ncbi:hypothetical protein ACFL0H_00185 [Thermodesulfobacteriota bacterium]
MKVAEAKKIVLDGIFRDISTIGLPIVVDHLTPDPSDPGKFIIEGKPARAIHHYDGWYVPINLTWFEGSFDQPRIQRGEFYWYAFAIPTFGTLARTHYLVCDFLQIREWVLEFSAPLGRDHKNHKNWRADIRVDCGLSGETQAYFRWGDEPLGEWLYPSRIVRLDNIAVVSDADKFTEIGLHVGATGPGGESEAHRRLKLFVAQNPRMLSLSHRAISEVEHRFITGDVVDVLFKNHGPLRTVAEIELAGTENIIVGIHQAIKYRVLAAAESDIHLYDAADPRAYVVSYEHGGQQALDFAGAYNVNLITVDKKEVLAPCE